jgi:hypothetical protein
MTSPASSSIRLAIEAEDIAALEAILGAGWGKPVRGHSRENEADPAVLVAVVQQGWLEGWVLFATHPQTRLLCHHPEVIRAVVTHSQMTILADLIKRGWHQAAGDVAIRTGNAPVLAAVVDAGWSWPVFTTQKTTHPEVPEILVPPQNVSLEDAALLFVVVQDDWLEGWRILATGRGTKETCQSREVIQRIIQGCRENILADVLERGWAPARWINEQDGRSWVHYLFYPLDRNEGHPPSPATLGRVARLFENNGHDIHAPYPGDFEAGERGRAGHSLWSYAIMFDAFALAALIWPTPLDKGGARMGEAMDAVFRTALVSEPGTPAGLRIGAAGLLRDGLGQSGAGAFVGLDPDIRCKLGRPWTDPLAWGMLLMLTPDARRSLMDTWALADGALQTGWHALARHADHVLFPTLLGEAERLGFDLQTLMAVEDEWQTRPVDTATLLMGYPLPDEPGEWEADRRLADLPDWPAGLLSDRDFLQ